MENVNKNIINIEFPKELVNDLLFNFNKIPNLLDGEIITLTSNSGLLCVINDVLNSSLLLKIGSMVLDRDELDDTMFCIAQSEFDVILFPVDITSAGLVHLAIIKTISNNGLEIVAIPIKVIDDVFNITYNSKNKDLITRLNKILEPILTSLGYEVNLNMSDEPKLLHFNPKLVMSLLNFYLVDFNLDDDQEIIDFN